MVYGPDGAAFSPTHTRKGGRLYRYYVSQSVLKHGAGSCPVGRVPAGEIEAAVIAQLRAVFRQPEIVAGTWKAAWVQDGAISEANARDALTRLDPLWDELFPAEQGRGRGCVGLHCGLSCQRQRGKGEPSIKSMARDDKLGTGRVPDFCIRQCQVGCLFRTDDDYVLPYRGSLLNFCQLADFLSSDRDFFHTTGKGRCVF